MAKTATLTASVSTDTRVSHIGRYFLDLRNTTGGRNVQLKTKICTAETAAQFLADCKAGASKAGVELTFIDATTGELSHLV